MEPATKVSPFVVPSQELKSSDSRILPRSTKRRLKTKKADTTENWVDFVDTEVQNACVQRLLECASGTCLILNSLSERGDTIKEGNIILSGLASALQLAADDVSNNYFRSPGALAHTLDPDTLAALLKRELKKLEARP